MIQSHDFGRMMGKGDDAFRRGCHCGGKGGLAEFYAPNVTVPSNIQGCNDNLAMVEFGHSVRFYYVFRMQRYENMTDVYTFVGMMDVDSLDVFLWNSKNIRNNQAKHQAGWVENLSPLLKHLKTIQRRDSGMYFGADNPWITNPPDNHPCMPGIPDDEVNLLLFMLVTGLSLNDANN
jgi:hypothetical protein